MAKFVNQSATILTPISEGGIAELQGIEESARLCYRSESKITPDGESAKSLITRLMKSDPPHEAMLEHSFLKVRFVTDRGISHELVRHRMASFAQESTRYCCYTKSRFDNQVTFIDPQAGLPLNKEMLTMDKALREDGYSEQVAACCQAEDHYRNLVGRGFPAQVARAVLPNCLKTEIDISANYREWRHILALRTGVGAHPMIRELMIGLLAELVVKIPVIFDDLIPTDTLGKAYFEFVVRTKIRGLVPEDVYKRLMNQLYGGNLLNETYDIFVNSLGEGLKKVFEDAVGEVIKDKNYCHVLGRPEPDSQ